MSWKRFIRLAIWGDVLIISSAWLCAIYLTLFQNFGNQWHPFYVSMPSGFIISIIAAIILPALFYVALHFFFYSAWKIRQWRSLKKTDFKMRIGVLLWLLGFTVWVCAIALETMYNYNLVMLTGGTLMIPLVIFGTFGMLQLMADIVEFTFICED